MTIRESTINDLEAIISLYHDDELGETRENINTSPSDLYKNAFLEIQSDKNNTIYVIEINGEIIGTMQLILIPHLTREGSKRAHIEAVRIRSDRRGQGFGKKLIEFAITEAKKSGCKIVQLTTDKSRLRAHKFYLDLGFTDNHIGMKLYV